MLAINPSKRITVEDALKHPFFFFIILIFQLRYFEDIHNEDDEPVFKGEVDFSFE